MNKVNREDLRGHNLVSTIVKHSLSIYIMVTFVDLDVQVPSNSVKDVNRCITDIVQRFLLS